MNKHSSAQPQRSDASTVVPMLGRLLQRRCMCGNRASGSCDACSRGAAPLQRESADGLGPQALPSIVHDVLRSPGRPLDASTRAFMEPRFGHDFSRVRVHTDVEAAESARSVNAMAYTVGRQIVFAREQYDPATIAGRRVLAHELAHVLQQRDRASSDELSVVSGEALEEEANAIARDIDLPARAVRTNAPVGKALMRLTPEEFRTKLGATAEQKTAIDTLFSDKTFLSLWDYLRSCPAKPTKDLGPLALQVTPGLKIGGVERYGGFSSLPPALEINPTKPEHKSNPAELVDTIVHELIHAVDDLQSECKAAGASDAPLRGAATVHPPKRADVAGPAEEQKLMQELGPGASNPCEEFIDINKAAQQMIIQILKHNIQVAKVGRPTITFVNEILRTNPKAMADYQGCRDNACAKPKADEKSKAIAACSADILSKYSLPEKKPAGSMAPPWSPAPAAGVSPPSPPPPGKNP